jgi:uncharacterized delta-60 repeat protein
MLRISQSDAAGSAMFRLSDGSVETTFSGDGIVSTAPLGAVYAVGTDSAGRVYVGGARNGEMAVARYLPNGTLDPGFGVAGVREIPVPGAPINCADHVRGLAIDSAGRVVVVGEVSGWYMFGVWTCSSDGFFDHPQHAGIARLTAGGGIDNSFSGDGVDLINGIDQFTGVGTRFEDVAVLDDDSIVAVGSHKSPGQGDLGLIARYSTLGVKEQQRIFDIGDGPFAGDDRFTAVDVQVDGKVVMSGSYFDSVGLVSRPVVRRVIGATIADDATYGAAGQLAPPAPTVGFAESIAVLANGSTMLLTTSGGGTTHLTRTTSGAAPDTVLDGDGHVSYVVAGADSMDLVEHEDGSILVAGTTTASGGDDDWHLRRILPSGGLDTRFSGDGVQVYEPTANSDQLRSIALGPDGLVVAAGRHDTSSGALVLDVVTVGDHAPPGNDWDPGGTSMFGACLFDVVNATEDWTTTGSCASNDTAPWDPIPADVASVGAKVAHASALVGNAEAHLQFGFRAAAALPPGTYLAPITFTVVAPDA